MKARYDIDYRKLAISLMPTVLRKGILTAFILLLVKPLQTIAKTFDDYRSRTDYRLAHNCQVCYLRALLNDTFDPFERRIMITDVDAVMSLVLYKRITNRHQIAPVRSSQSALKLGRRGYGGLNGYDFAISIPAALVSDPIYSEARLRALVDTYKLASKRYTITYINQ